MIVGEMYCAPRLGVLPDVEGDLVSVIFRGDSMLPLSLLLSRLSGLWPGCLGGMANAESFRFLPVESKTSASDFSALFGSLQVGSNSALFGGTRTTLRTVGRGGDGESVTSTSILSGSGRAGVGGDGVRILKSLSLRCRSICSCSTSAGLSVCFSVCNDDVSTVTLSSFSVSDMDTCHSGLDFSFTLLLGSKLDRCGGGSELQSLLRPIWSLWRGCSANSGDDSKLLTITRILLRLGAELVATSLRECFGVFTLMTRRFCAVFSVFFAGDLVIFALSSVDAQTPPADSQFCVSWFSLFHV